MPVVARSTQLAAPAPLVWRHATTIAGINRELAPWMTMTVPPEYADLSLDDERVAIGERLFVSGVRLFGRLPVDRMALTLVELERGRRFVEESPMRSMRRWRHEREVVPIAGGCEVRDTLTFEPRLRAAAPVARAMLDAFFAHRHRRLIALFQALRGRASSTAMTSSAGSSTT